jgi:hypothetical protein
MGGMDGWRLCTWSTDDDQEVLVPLDDRVDWLIGGLYVLIVIGFGFGFVGLHGWDGEGGTKRKGKQYFSRFHRFPSFVWVKNSG